MGDRLQSKVALITGAGMGMGREACEVFAREGARIVALDVDEAALAQTAAAVTGSGGAILTCVADVADEAAVQAAVEAGCARFGGLHVLYNNAGVLWRDKDFASSRPTRTCGTASWPSTSKAWSGCASTACRS